MAFLHARGAAALHLSAALVAAITLASAPAFGQAARKSELFDAAQLLKDLQVLSSDDMQGRQVGTPGGEKARAYVLERFKAAGIQPFGDSFAQPFSFTGGRRC